MFAAVKPSGENVTVTLMPVERPSNRAGRPFTVIFVAGVTQYSFAKWLAKILIVIEVRCRWYRRAFGSGETRVTTTRQLTTLSAFSLLMLSRISAARS